MAGLMLHSGAELVTLEQLKDVPVPEQTDSYVPIPHSQIVNLIHETVNENGLSIVKTEVGIKDRKRGDEIQHGAKMFGVCNISGSSESVIGDSLFATIGFRSSLDKSIAPGFVGGAGVFVCDNMVLTGNIISIRKQTPNVLYDLYRIVARLVANVKERFGIDNEMRMILKSLPIDTQDGLDLIGSFAANGQLAYAGGTSSPFALAIREWTSPSFPEFNERNIWSLYNACTFGLKRVNLTRSFESNIKLTHRVIEDYAPSLVPEYDAITA